LPRKHLVKTVRASAFMYAVADSILPRPLIVKKSLNLQRASTVWYMAKDIAYACSEPGQMEIREDIREHDLDRIVVGSCSPRLHEITFRRMMQQAGLNPYLLEMANLREQCSWVHMKEPAAATLKAEDLIKMSISRVRLLYPLYEETIPLTKRTLVIGAGVAGIQAALDLADSGYEVVMVEKSPSIGGTMAQLDKTFPTMDCSI
jgi:heterodisulfide reductase subunit A-like polyferredoxin